MPDYDVFLAHAGPDKSQARALYRLLVPGLGVFLDCETLLPGDEWDVEIPKAQRRSVMSVILVSRAVEAAFYLRDEIASAIALHRARPEEHRVVPVYLDGVPRDPLAIPYGLRILSGLDAVAEGGLEGVAERLKALAARMKGLPVAEAVPAPGQTESGAGPGLDARGLYGKLIRLLPAQFETFVFLAELPVEHIPTAPAPLAMRALSVVQLLQQGGAEAVAEAMAALRQVAPGMV